MRESNLVKKRNNQIFDRYAEFWSKGIREELIWSELQKEFYLQPYTLYRIVLNERRNSIEHPEVLIK
ncbi:hypothetical protein [Mucilaginibacter sp.]